MIFIFIIKKSWSLKEAGVTAHDVELSTFNLLYECMPIIVSQLSYIYAYQ